MNEEPVAWAYILDGGDFMDAIHPEEHNRHEGKYTTPLYTHPAKTLTDEEIKQLAYQHRWNGDVDFAKAILRKAQEK
jgi:hypothetical protein